MLLSEALKLMENGQLKQAMEMKKGELHKLKEIEKEDTSGFITKLIENEEKAIADMETKNQKEAMKTVHYNSYVHDMNDYYMM